MPDLSPYLHGLHPWYGFGGHEEVTEVGMEFAHGKDHDYRTRRLGDEDFIAEQRPRGGAWAELSRHHKTAYIAGMACAAAEGRALGSTPPRVVVAAGEVPSEKLAVAGTPLHVHGTTTQRLDTSKENEVSPPKKLSAVERLLARDRAEGKG